MRIHLLARPVANHVSLSRGGRERNTSEAVHEKYKTDKNKSVLNACVRCLHSSPAIDCKLLGENSHQATGIEILEKGTDNLCILRFVVPCTPHPPHQASNKRRRTCTRRLKVALNMRVCRSGRVCCTMERIWYSNPMSNIRSASSRICPQGRAKATAMTTANAAIAQ